MFRNPRKPAVLLSSDAFQTPSVGRPPTPPSTTPKEDQSIQERPISTMTSSPITLSRSKTLSKTAGRSSNLSVGKTKAKPNASILSFFKKTAVASAIETQDEDAEESLFIEDDDLSPKNQEVIQIPTPPRDKDSVEASPKSSDDTTREEEPSRFNEENSAFKRRRMESPSSCSRPPMEKNRAFGSGKGPFIEDSDDEDVGPYFSFGHSEAPEKPQDCSFTETSEVITERKPVFMDEADLPKAPRLKEEFTSIAEENDFQELDDFIEDEFPEEGEEYMERRWMEEQRLFDLGLEEDVEVEDGSESKERIITKTSDGSSNEGSAVSCPICSMCFKNLTDEEASVHVNDCLDGKTTLPPIRKTSASDAPGPAPQETKTVITHKRFQRSAIAKPGQENPVSLMSHNVIGSSAFSKIMSSHAEDTAWATAAATEAASRGKPAYQRTCPFYKILPGFFICVDAFRYGAVAGCKAYFLSHFHSDHYIGLTSSWCHGPIYCSHVTANLVRRQLRVDPKWVFDLEFDCKVEVPETEGVHVTMIPANHCPGSSLYLFEKVVGKGKTPKVYRVLHCGDFRACPAHVQHPQLRPNIVDAVTGRNIGQQKLDVCYLDTTYLTPKYAFPNQEEVIQACADMCVSLSKERIDENDSWERTKQERAGSGMVQFVRKGSDIKPEMDDEDGITSTIPGGPRARGRLLVIVGTYSIGKERICLGIARALDSKIYAPPHKQKICAALEDAELTARLTSDPLEAQVHMQMLMEIRAETLADYLSGYKQHFSRVVGFRPSGWNYRPPRGRFVESPAVQTVLHSASWRSRYTMAELVPQRGSTAEAHCFGVPYSEHSSFRELSMFCCALRIDRIIPTVNVGSAKSREKMKGWCDKWAADKKKHGLFPVADGQAAW